MIIAIILIIINGIIGGVFLELKNKDIEFKETTKNEDVVFCNLSTIKMFKEKIYCLNDTQRMILVLSEDGDIEKNILLPGRNDAGTSDMYIMKNNLCIITVNNELYQYDSYQNYKKIIYDKNKMRVYDKNNNLVRQMKAYDDQILYYGGEGKDIITYDFENNLLKEYQEGSRKEKKISYDKLTANNNTIVHDKITYEIGKLKNVVYKKEGDKKTILHKTKYQDTLLHSNIIMNSSIIILIICAILGKVFAT